MATLDPRCVTSWRTLSRLDDDGRAAALGAAAVSPPSSPSSTDATSPSLLSEETLDDRFAHGGAVGSALSLSARGRGRSSRPSSSSSSRRLKDRAPPAAARTASGVRTPISRSDPGGVGGARPGSGSESRSSSSSQSRLGPAALRSSTDRSSSVTRSLVNASLSAASARAASVARLRVAASTSLARRAGCRSWQRSVTGRWSETDVASHEVYSSRTSSSAAFGNECTRMRSVQDGARRPACAAAAATASHCLSGADALAWPLPSGRRSSAWRRSRAR
mmetsp:Transcript_23053/g.77827  ORF Transcript_23053/g.77827 Transcript_23053/m.77827 type:complete len:277 (+) Transcript_23053:657-1487(+)